MKNLHCIDHYRMRAQERELRLPDTTGDFGAGNGVFKVFINGRSFQVIASDGLGWDHVSVSKPGRVPSWDEMCAIKDMFFGPDEWVVQYHPAEKDYVNIHMYCLHLWRPQNEKLPTPPKIMV